MTSKRALSCIVLLIFSSLTLTAATPKKQSRYFPYRNSPRQTTSQPPGLALVNAASFLPGVSPGSLATIFGQNLSFVSGVIVANNTPLPLELGGIQVQVNGVSAGMFSVASTNGQDQISFQVPWETDTGPGAVQVTILNAGNVAGTIQADSYTEDPGIFASNGYAVAVDSDFSLITEDNPANPGDTIVLYTTGLGPVSVDVPDGAPSSTLAYTQDPFQVMVEGEQCQVAFSGLAPGFVGVYQLNIVLPRDLPPGDLDLQISSPYEDSNTVKIPVS